MSAAGLPYRPNVGIALFNEAGLVFAGMALNEGPEEVEQGFEWQMPQGGIDPNENLEVAARRELFEETGIEEVSFLAATEPWWDYDFPLYSGPPHALSGFRGQTQRWVALRFEGDERRINVTEPLSGLRPEFSAWAWTRLGALPDLVMPHKQATYRKVAQAFARFAAEA